MFVDEPGQESFGRQVLRALRLDIPLVIGILCLGALGMIVLYSAGGEEISRLTRQGVRFLMAFGVALVLAQIPVRSLRAWSPWVYAAGVVLLILVLVIGQEGKGAQRWLDLGLFTFQPSEMMKLATPMMIAWYLSERPLPPRAGPLLAAGLLDDQHHRHRQEQAGRQQRPRSRRQRPLGEIPGDHHGRGEFHHFRGLKGEQPQVEPALCTLALLPDRQHQDQQDDPHCVHPGGPGPQTAHGDLRQHQGDAEGHEEAHPLAREPRNLLPTGTVEDDHAERPQAQNADHQGNIQAQRPHHLASE